MNPQLRKPMPNRMDITKIAQGQPVESCMDSHPCLTVFQTTEPLGESGALYNFNYKNIVTSKIQPVKQERLVRLRGLGALRFNSTDD